MDNHPIPQDVTGFQFRLIGDMTVKQFAYVAVGGIFAVVFLYAPMPFLLRIPFMILFGGIGAILAFVPLEGRPVDLMISYFLKALFSPNQYAYQKLGGIVPIFAYTSQKQAAPGTQVASQDAQKNHTSPRDIEKEQKLSSYLLTHHSKKLSVLDRREEDFMQKLFPQALTQVANTQSTSQTQSSSSAPVPAPVPTPIQTAPVAPSRPSPEQDVALPTDENQIAQELAKAHLDENSERDLAKKQAAHAHVSELEKQLTGVRLQKKQLEEEIEKLRQEATSAKKAEQADITEQTDTATRLGAETPTSPQSQTPPEPTVRKISLESAKDLGLPHVPEDPNLILGIIKDSRGNALSNILVEVKDKHGNPARAFRTNQLGHFASATQLPDGTYTIDFEDPKEQHMFDTVEVNATGEVIMPIEVISHDDREELRKALFN